MTLLLFNVDFEKALDSGVVNRSAKKAFGLDAIYRVRWSITLIKSVLRLFALDTFQDCKVSDRWVFVENSSKRKSFGRLGFVDLSYSSLGPHHFWNSWIPRKVNICVWKASINRLPTRSNLIERGFGGVCPRVFPFFSISDISLGNFGFPNNPLLSKVLIGVFQCALWGVWKWRNKVPNASDEDLNDAKNKDIFPSIQRLSKLWISARCKRRSLKWSCWISNPRALLDSG
ncbi:hypothetical protein Tco_0605880 [Tanacetum coccineum]